MSISDLPIGVLNKVLEYASTPETSSYRTFTILNKEFNKKTKATRDFAWGHLREHWKTLPEFHVLKSCFAEADKIEESTYCKFKELSRKTQISYRTLFCTGQYRALMQEHDAALCTIWDKKLRDKLIDKLPVNTILPAAAASAKDIREFLEEKKEILETIIELDLQVFSLKALPPEILLLCKNLKQLYLNNNELKELVIPKECVNLQRLDLSNNQLEEFVIPKECVNLQKLNLKYNQLKEFVIPKECVNLEELYLGYNRLKEFILPEECVNLRGISLHCNRLKEFILPEECVNLRGISLHHNQLEEFVLPNTCVNILSIFLSYNQLEEFVLPSTCVNIQVLHLDYNQLKKLVLHNRCVKLQSLSLNSNQLEELILPKMCVSLQELSLNSNPLKELVLPKVCVNLKQLYLCDNVFLLIPPTLANRSGSTILYAKSQYESKSPLGCLFKKISAKESIKGLITTPKEEFTQLFSLLTETQKNKIFHTVSKGAGRPVGDTQWGEHHCFDNIVLFSTAVQKSIFDTFNELPQEERNKVEHEVYRLVVAHFGEETREMQNDLFWAKHHALDDLVLLAEALFNVKEGRL